VKVFYFEEDSLVELGCIKDTSIEGLQHVETEESGTVSCNRYAVSILVLFSQGVVRDAITRRKVGIQKFVAAAASSAFEMEDQAFQDVWDAMEGKGVRGLSLN
jgi:hypothetical protein